MTSNSAELKLRLNSLGLSDAAINAAWPTWWSQEADGSVSAQTELRFGVARRLGLDPRSLFDESEKPRFLWQEEARFKHLSGEGDVERAGIASFGRAVASILVSATPHRGEIVGSSALDLRRAILASGRPFIDLADLLSLCWGVGVPVIYLRVFPWHQKRMAAMTVRVGDRWAILLARDSDYPAPIAFYLAHELGHIGLAHLEVDRVIVDLEEDIPSVESGEDEEEAAADEFALQLLTGHSRPEVLPSDAGAAPTATRLAQAALDKANDLKIEPGTLALCFGYSTQDWPTAMGALRAVYANAAPAWQAVNRIAMNQLTLEDIPDDAASFIAAVLGQGS